MKQWYCCERRLKTDTEEKTFLNKVVIFVFLAHKKYSRSFIKLRLNTDITWTILMMSLLPFWTLNMSVCFLYRVRKILDFMKNNLVCVPKMNKGLTGLELHEGE